MKKLIILLLPAITLFSCKKEDVFIERFDNQNQIPWRTYVCGDIKADTTKDAFIQKFDNNASFEWVTYYD